MQRRFFSILTVLGLAAAGLLAGLLSSPGAPGASAGGPALDFSIGVNPYGLTAGDACDSSGSPTAVCSIQIGDAFSVSFYLHQFPEEASGSYDSYDWYLDFSGVTANSVDFDPWPDCYISIYSLTSSSVSVACIANTTSTYAGKLATVTFTCTSTGTITMQHGAGETQLHDAGASLSEGDAASESLSINCLPPQAHPADSDGDGCPDHDEKFLGETRGGKRNYLNPYDYFNPTHDLMNRVDDIITVVEQYYIDQGMPGYDPNTDRTDDPAFGPEQPWRLLGPNGLQRVDDILHAVKQFFHDCP